MARLQLAIDVADLDASIDFYTRLLGTPPAKVRDGYANFAVDDPPLKLVLFEAEVGGTINHLGVEVEHASEVEHAEARLRGAGLATTGVDDTICCYATKVETWVTDPDDHRWEWYVRTGDAEQLENTTTTDGGSTCCPPVDTAIPADQPAGRAAGPAPDARAASSCC